jgi:hypothetical protein
MVRVTRFSFDDGMNVRYPIPRESFDDDDLDDYAPEDEVREPTPTRGAPSSRRRGSRSNPNDRSTDRRHLAGGDWMSRPPVDEANASRDSSSDGSRQG